MGLFDRFKKKNTDNASAAPVKLKHKKEIEANLNVIRSYREGENFMPASNAIKALGELGEEVVPTLLNEVENGPAKKGYVLRALAATGSPRALDALKEGMADSSLPSYEHEHIAKGLGKIGTPEAVDALMNALDTADDEGVVKTIAKCLGDLNVEIPDLEAKKKAAEIKAAKKLMEGLKFIHPGMTEDEADDLVGPGVFQMGPNVVHNTRFGNFQLLVSGNIVTGKIQTEGVIANIEEWLQEQEQA